MNGAGVFVTPADVASGKVPIYAASNFLKELSDEGVATLPIVATRAAYMYGFSLTGQEAEDFHVGCCGGLNKPGKNESDYIPPTQFVEVDGARDIEIAGVKLHLFHTGGEAASHIAAWLPDYQVLIRACLHGSAPPIVGSSLQLVLCTTTEFHKCPVAGTRHAQTWAERTAI